MDDELVLGEELRVRLLAGASPLCTLSDGGLSVPAAGLAARTGRVFPHLLQNFAPSLLGAPHLLQNIISLSVCIGYQNPEKAEEAAGFFFANVATVAITVPATAKPNESIRPMPI